MSKPCTPLFYLSVGGNQTIPANSDHITDSTTVSKQNGYSIVFEMSGLDADPKITIEASNDGVQWNNLYSIVNDISTGDITPVEILLTKAFSNTSSGIGSVRDESFQHLYLRVNYQANGVTSGTIKYQYARP